MPKVFISGVQDDHPGVGRLIEQLRTLEYQISVHGESPGDRRSWDRALRDIAESDVFIPIITPAALRSQCCRRQFDWAERLARPVLPVVVAPPAAAPPPRFLAYRIVDYSQPALFDESSATLNAALTALKPVPPLPDPLPRPPRAPRWAGRLGDSRVRAAAALAVVTVAVLVAWLCEDEFASRAEAVKIIVNDDGVFVGSVRAASTIDLITDPFCVPCARVANATASDIRKAVHDKKIAVRYHLINDFDWQSASGDYSTRAVAAATCVAESKEPERYQAFEVALFAPDFQPKRKADDVSTDRSNAELAELARRTGASATVSNCIAGGQRVQAAKREATNAEALLKRLTGLNLVPQIYLGIREVDHEPAGWIDNLR